MIFVLRRRTTKCHFYNHIFNVHWPIKLNVNKYTNLHISFVIGRCCESYLTTINKHVLMSPEGNNKRIGKLSRWIKRSLQLWNSPLSRHSLMKRARRRWLTKSNLLADNYHWIAEEWLFYANFIMLFFHFFIPYAARQFYSNFYYCGDNPATLIVRLGWQCNEVLWNMSQVALLLVCP